MLSMKDGFGSAVVVAVERCVLGSGLTRAQHEHMYVQSWCVTRVNLSINTLHLQVFTRMI